MKLLLATLLLTGCSATYEPIEVIPRPVPPIIEPIEWSVIDIPEDDLVVPPAPAGGVPAGFTELCNRKPGLAMCPK